MHRSVLVGALLANAFDDPGRIMVGAALLKGMIGSKHFLRATNRPSTAGMEARIQRRTSPAVGCADFVVPLFSVSGGGIVVDEIDLTK